MESLNLNKNITMSKQNRKKTTKSCTFCQLRKLKCDRKRPICGSCSLRNRARCIYGENLPSKENELRKKYRKHSKLDMAHHIEELEARILKQTESSLQQNLNPVCNVKYLSTKHNRHILYGPTSYRAILAARTDSFFKYREKIWDVLKRKRNDWKREHHYSTLSEISFIESAPSHSDSPSVIASLCNSLPTYEKLKKCLIDFFASDFYRGFSIVSERKSLKDFEDCFVKGPKDPDTGFHPIKTLNLDAKKNYYKVGVITVIMCISMHPIKIPESVELFHKALTSFVSAKVFYVERVQFLYLRYIYINVAGLDGGDQSHCIFLHGLTIDTAIHMGLNEDICHLFSDKSHPNEEIPYLERLWLWILFTDVKISLSTGIPPRIDEVFVHEKPSEMYYSSMDKLLNKTVMKLRTIMKELHNHRVRPNIPLIIQDLKKYTAENFKPLTFYFDISNLKGSEFVELQLWHTSLQMLASLSSLHSVIYEDYSPMIFNTSILAPLNTLNLCYKVLEGYFALDNRRCSLAYQCFSRKWPHLNSALPFVYMDSFRALIQIYTILLQFIGNKNNQSLMQAKMAAKNQQIILGDIEGWNESCVSLIAAFQEMESIFKHIHDDKLKSLREVLQNSYYFTIIISMEKIGREAFGKVIERMQEDLSVPESNPSNNLTDVLGDLEKLLMDFSGTFTDDVVAHSDDFFNTPYRDWNNFEDFFQD